MDPWLEVAAGRALFRVDGLLRLSDLVASVAAGAADAVGACGGPSQCGRWNHIALKDRSHPSPFDPRMSTRYGLARAGRVDLKAYDVLGRVVLTLVDGVGEMEVHRAARDGRDDAGRVVGAAVNINERDPWGRPRRTGSL